MNMDIIKQSNSLNTIRLLVAIEVMWGHMVRHLNISFPKLGGVSLEVIVSKILSLFPGVPVFFFLSGFLIWFSVNKGDNAKVFFLKRFYRIYPELWIGILVSITTILIFYFENIRWGWLAIFTVTQSTVLQFWTPDFLRGYGCGTPNGSLWTICITVQFYILIWVFHGMLKYRGMVFWICVLAGSIAWGSLTGVIGSVFPEIIYKLYCQTLMPYIWIFLLGMIVAQFGTYIVPYLRRWWWIFFFVLLLIRIVHFDVYLGNYPLFGTATAVYGCLGLAYALPKINIKYDISYPLYIYHGIFINVAIETKMPGNLGLLFTILMTLLFSVLSTTVHTKLCSVLTVRRG